MVSGVILGAPTLRLRGDYLAIVTLGFGEIVRITAINTDEIGGARGITPIPHPPPFLGVEFKLDPLPYYYLILFVIVLAIIFSARLQRSRVGRAWTAIREDEDAAELMGVPTFKFKLLAFAIGAMIGGLAGTVFASKVIFIAPTNFPFILSATILAAVLLGGAGNLPGVILGAFLIAWLPERFRGFADYRILVFGAALVLTMTLRPQGLLPSRQRSAELKTSGTSGLAAAVPTATAPMPGEDEQPVGEAESMSTYGKGVLEPHDEPARPDRVMLALDNVTMRFGGVVALRSATFDVRAGEIFALIGPNGAGKTTVFNVVTGVFRPTEGQVLFNGSRIDGMKRFKVTKAGVARTFQNIRLFHNMSAVENVMVGVDAHHRTGAVGAALGLSWHRREEREGREQGPGAAGLRRHLRPGRGRREEPALR